MEAVFSFFVGLVTAILSFFTYAEPPATLPVPDGDGRNRPVPAETVIVPEIPARESVPSATLTAPKSADFVITSPSPGTVFKGGEELTIAWRLPETVLSSFSEDFQLGLFLNVVSETNPSVNVYALNDGTNDPRSGSVVWKLPADIASGNYRIEGYLSASPKDAARLCTVKVGKDCRPTEADAATMARAQQYRDEGEWFSVVASQKTESTSATQTIQISQSQAYGLSVPAAWRAEASVTTNTSTSGAVYSAIYVYDEKDRLVMMIQQPIREVGYESMVAVSTSTLETAIGALNQKTRAVESTIVGEVSVAMAEGFAQYSWDGGGDFWNNSFEIFVHFRKSSFAKTAEEQQAGTGDTVRWKSLGEFNAEREMIETILKSIR